MLGIARKSLLVFSVLAVSSQAHAIDRRAPQHEPVASELLQFLESILDGHQPEAQWSKVRRGADLCWRTRECGLLDQALFPSILPLSGPQGRRPCSPHLHPHQEQI